MRYAVLVILCLVLSSVFPTQNLADRANLTLGPEGDILAWLVLGPLPHGVPHKACRGFEMDYLSAKGGESGVAPAEGETVPSTDRILRWRLGAADTAYGLDLLSAFDWHGPGVAYAYAAIVNPSRRDARLLLGSDDGVKVWVNGVLAHTKHVTRGVTRDEDQIAIRLRAGTNRLLFKIDQNIGGWGLMARIVGPDDSPMPDLVETLDVQPAAPKSKETFPVSTIRATASKPGTLDVHAANLFLASQREAEIWMPWLRRNPDKGEPLQRIVESWTSKVDEALSASPDKLSAVLADAATSIEEQFGSAWAAFDRRMQNPEPLVKADPAKEDYIRVASGGRYFVQADGTFYTPIGYNHNPDWPKTIECAPGLRGYAPEVTQGFFKHLRTSGVNLIRLMVETPAGGFYLEDPIGTFDPEQAAWLDNIVTFARNHDIKLMITPWDTFWMSHRWDTNPYNSKNGGPVDKKSDFITRREVIEAQKKRWKYMIDRWGNTGTIFAWELLNESDYWWGSSPEQVIAWAKEMADFVREYERRKWGGNHLICISTGRAVPKDEWGDLAFRQPELDFATTHIYIGAANAPSEPIGPALAERQGVVNALAQIRDNRPYMDGENGPINRWIADEKLDNEVFHNMVWAHMASGGAGSGLRWPYRNPHHLSEGMYRALSLMSRFAKSVPWRKLTGPPAQVQVSVPEGWVACSTGTREAGLIWVTAAKLSPCEINVSWPEGPEKVRYRCYDTKTGEWFTEGMADGVLRIPVDRLSVAVVIQGE